MASKILLFGAQGLLGMQFLYDFSNEFEILPFSRFNLDLTDTERIMPEILRWEPDAVVNCAAWTDVERAENPKFKDVVWAINVAAPREMAKACKKLAIPFFHISTDFVFSGEKGTVFLEETNKNPLSVYGKSKSAGEDASLQENAQTYIVRTAWLYGEYGANFVGRVQELAKVSPELRMVDDQQGNPTWTKYVAEVLALLIREAGTKFAPGIYHAVSGSEGPAPSWRDFAVEILKLSHQERPVRPTTTIADPLKAPRAASTVLENTKLPVLPEWTIMLKEYMEKGKNKL